MGLTTQLQQLTQLMTSPAPAPTITPPLIPVSPPSVSPPSLVPAALSKKRARSKLLSLPDFSGEQSSDQAFFYCSEMSKQPIRTQSLTISA